MEVLDSPNNLNTKIEAIVRKIIETEFNKLISEGIARFVAENEFRAKELSLMERTIRIEEELKSFKEIVSSLITTMEKRFDVLQKETVNRFEALQREMNARFEAFEKRTEALQREMNARFDALKKRFTVMQWTIGLGFSLTIAFIGLLKFWH